MIGRIYVSDEGGGGAYFIEGGDLCHAPKLVSGRLDWSCAAQVDSRDLDSPDPGWDFARWARRALLSRMGVFGPTRGAVCQHPTHEFNEGHAYCACGLDHWQLETWCAHCGNEGHTADDCDERPA